MNMCSAPLGTNSMWTLLGHFVFLKIIMSKERSSILPWDSYRLYNALIKLPSLLDTSQVYCFSHRSKCFHPLELEGVTSVVECVACVKCFPIPVIRQDDPPPWIAGD